MASIIIVGDGPGGLGAALFLAKGKQEVTVYGQDETAMNYATLYNYLGLEVTGGVDFQDDAKKQVADLGATIVDARVEAVRAFEDRVEADVGGETISGDYLVLSEGNKAPLAESLGLEKGPGGIPVDRNSKSAVARVYVVGRSTRPGRSQAIISAGDGAAAALDIMAEVEGRNWQDWDS